MRDPLVPVLAVFVVVCCGGKPPGAAEPSGVADIVFSEVHYHPAGGRDALEFIELHNRGRHWLDVGGYSLTLGVDFSIPPGTVLAPKGYLVVARKAAAVREAYGIDNVVGDFDGRLSDDGEVLELRTRDGTRAAWFRYADGADPTRTSWPRSPDGHGPSLELLAAEGDADRPWLWAPSRVPGGTPGAPNSARAAYESDAEPLPDLAITEVRLPGKTDGDADPAAGPFFVEVQNRGSRTVSLAGLRLTRHPAGAGGVPVAGSIGKGKYRVIEALGDLAQSKGKRLFLVRNRDHAIIDSIRLLKSSQRGSVARDPEDEYRSVLLAKPSPGKRNSFATLPRVVIHEIHYHGAQDGELEDTGNGEDAPEKRSDEFVELHNASSSAVDIGGWRLAGGLSFTFPAETSLPARGYLVVAKDAEGLRRVVDSKEKKRILGPAKGKLSNRADTVELLDRARRRVDFVRYTDRRPWPDGADGSGLSLELIHPSLDNAFAAAWTLGPSRGTPGRANARSLKRVRPIVVDAWVEPAAPRPGETVTVHARVISSSKPSKLSVLYSDLTFSGTKPGRRKPAASSRRAMSDRGRLGDGAAGDGHYAVKMPAARAGALVGFAIVGRSGGRSFRYPVQETEELLYEVRSRADGGGEDAVSVGGPTYTVLMTPARWEEMLRARRRAKPVLPCTIVREVFGPGVRPLPARAFHNARIRYRGNNSFRGARGERFSYRIKLADGDELDGRRRINLHAFDAHRQKIGGDLMRLAGLVAPRVTLARVRVPGESHQGYLDVEVVDGAFIRERWGQGGGEVFRGKRGPEMNNPFGADFSLHGSDPAPYLKVYLRANKSDRTDADSLIALIRALNTRDDDEYAKRVREVIDPAEWARYFAVNNLIGNDEGGLSTGDPDDFYLLRRPSDGRFLLVPWDQDTTFVKKWERDPLFHRTVPVLQRFLRHPEFAPLYWRAVRELIGGPFSRAGFSAQLRRLESHYPRERLSGLGAFVERRHAFLDPRAYPRMAVGATGGDAKGGGRTGVRSSRCRRDPTRRDDRSRACLWGPRRRGACALRRDRGDVVTQSSGGSICSRLQWSLGGVARSRILAG